MTDWPELVMQARALADGPRRLLGITGAPGAGKTVLASALVVALGPRARLVGMDGYHLSNAELARLGRLDRKGAPDTFDAEGYVALLHRLKRGESDVRAPRFDRDAEEPVPGAVEVPADVPLVITEGNYLLLEESPWSAIRDLLDECWYVEVPEDERLARLVSRHMAYGRSAGHARDRALGSDLRNAQLVATSRARATRIVRPPALQTSTRT